MERLFSPSPKEESCHIMGSGEMLALKLRQRVLVPLRYLRTRFAWSQCCTVHLDMYLLRWLTAAVMSRQVQFER